MYVNLCFRSSSCSIQWVYQILSLGTCYSCWQKYKRGDQNNIPCFLDFWMKPLMCWSSRNNFDWSRTFLCVYIKVRVEVKSKHDCRENEMYWSDVRKFHFFSRRFKKAIRVHTAKISNEATWLKLGLVKTRNAFREKFHEPFHWRPRHRSHSSQNT